MKRALAAILMMMALRAYATPFATDVTDLWLDPQEPGWGVTIYQQGDTLFATFFVFSANGPTWYSASSAPYSGQNGNSLIYSGPLYQFGGSPFSTIWNPNARSNRQVGTLTLTFSAIDAATITYSVDGVNVTKPLARFAFKENSIVGSYIGATIGTYSGCAQNGYVEEPAVFSVTQSGNIVTIHSQPTVGGTCTFSGAITQAGRLNAISGGVLACSNGVSGTFDAFELHANISGLTGRAIAQYGGGCAWSGRLGGLRRN
jgi:hypothetical protein